MFSYIIRVLDWFKKINDIQLQCEMCGIIFNVYKNRNTDIKYYCSYQCGLRSYNEEKTLKSKTFKVLSNL